MKLYWCYFWNGRKRVRRQFAAHDVDDLQTKAFCIAYREGWQMLGYEECDELELDRPCPEAHAS